MFDKHPVFFAILFGLLALALLPFTCLWAFFAYLAGDKVPLFALRGGDIDKTPLTHPKGTGILTANEGQYAPRKGYSHE